MTRRGWPRQLGRQDTKVDATTIHLEGQARSSEGESRVNGRGGAVGPAAPHQRAGSSGVRGLRDVGGVRRVTAAHRRRGRRGAQRLARGLAGAAAGLRHAGHACQELRRLSHTAPTTRRAYQHPARTDMLRGGRLRGVRPPPCDVSRADAAPGAWSGTQGQPRSALPAPSLLPGLLLPAPGVLPEHGRGAARRPRRSG